MRSKISQWKISSYVQEVRESDHLEDPGVDGRLILQWIFRKWDGGMECIDLAQIRDR
jgi:hypothetical protein